MTATATATPADLDRLDDAELADRLAEAGGRIRTEIRKVIVGNDAIIEQALIALFAGGNCLLVGVPGLAKTLLISTMSRALALSFSRIQFTPDLMPSDVTGTDVIQDDPETGHRRLIFMPGPVFANVLLAVANFNNDISEYWEFSDEGMFPLDMSNEAYKLGVNYLIYALTR